ncbi:MAG TPA: FAD-binding protein [Cyclobacteriaceae bacterium]|nr:FAD-binding protein [Cyclobacteriaceae bacterium]
MRKRTFLKLSSAILTTAAIAPLESCTSPESKSTRHNWAGNIDYSSENLHEPATVEELREIILKEKKIRPQGTSHSFNGIDNSTAGFVRLLKMNQVVSLDETNMTVTVQAGMRYGDLARYLEPKGYALHNLASLPHISIGGAIATATHGSGVNNGSLTTAVQSMKVMNAAGELTEIPATVHLGSLGVVTEVTLKIQPTFQLRQWVFQYLPMSSLKDHFEEIMGSGYSVSLFFDWASENINQVWVKKKVTPEDPGDAPKDFFGAKVAPKDLHPIETIPAVNCTPQMGVAGPWHERLPHFKMDFTPSAGEELQAEYFVPKANGYAAIEAVYALRDKVSPLIQITEVRSIAADNIPMSPFRNQDSIAIHFTWKKNWEGVRAVLPLIEAALEQYNVKPHWGKLFTLKPSVLQSKYEELPEFKAIMKQGDPDGKFRNEFIDKNLFAS